MADDMATEGPGEDYSLSRTYTASSDKNGHSKWIRVRVPEHFRGPIGGIVDKIDGYKSEADFVRDALVHRLRYHEKIGTLLPDQTAAYWILENAEQMTAKIKLYAGIQQQIRDLASACQSAGASSHLSEYLDSYQAQADLLPEPFRTQVNATIKKVRALS